MGEGSGEGRAGTVPPGPHPLSDRELGIKRVAPPQDVVSLEKRPRVGVPPQVVQDPEVVTKGPTVPPEDLPRVSTTGDVTKGDSQKADNASVPDHLWLRAFFVGYEACAARHREALTSPSGFVGALGKTEPPAGWRGAIPGFRLLALRYWRARTTQGYTAWRKANVPLPPSGGGKMVQYRWQAPTRPVYDWTNRGKKLYQAEWRTLRSHPEGRATVEAGYDAIHRCANATWFEWPKGSAPLFWNWGKEYQRAVRDGQPHFMIGSLDKPFMRKQAKAKDSLKHELMRAKVVEVRQRGYIKPGNVTSGTHYFCVDKGTSDIRMVYNGTSCGLNACLHAPHYGLLSVKHTLRSLMSGYYQCDLDVGEQFLNFKLHEALRQLSGVDVREVRSRDPEDGQWEDSRPGNWERWERNWMGLRDSPYRSLQWQARLKLEVYGDCRALANPFHWDRVVFNLPGSKGYRADLPWVMKIRWDGELAAEVFVYVDNGRATGPTELLAWQAGRAYGAGCTRRGVQDASRKRTSPSQTPGPWAGTVTHTDGGKVCGMVSKEKWDKTKRLVAELEEMVARDYLPLTRLLQIRGFLMYVVRTYPWINPYMKGLHLTIDSWLRFRGPDGFNLRGKELASALAWDIDGAMPCRREEDNPENAPEVGNAHGREGNPDEPPVHVSPAPQFLQD